MGFTSIKAIFFVMETFLEAEKIFKKICLFIAKTTYISLAFSLWSFGFHYLIESSDITVLKDVGMLSLIETRFLCLSSSLKKNLGNLVSTQLENISAVQYKIKNGIA